MDDVDLSKTDHRSLARLMKFGSAGGGEWTDRDLAGIWTHLLESRVRDELTEAGILADEQIRPLLVPWGAAEPDFANLLFSGVEASSELFSHVKRFAKTMQADAAGSFPRKIALALYFVTLMSADQKGHIVTTLPTAELANGGRWCLAQPWIDERSRALLNECLARIEWNEADDNWNDQADQESPDETQNSPS